jgi:hypothetical protein
MRPIDWPSYHAMKGHRGARINEAARILLTPAHLQSFVAVASPRACRGNIVFAEAAERLSLTNELFEQPEASSIHCVLSHLRSVGEWSDHFDVGYRVDGRLTWYVRYHLWMRSEDELAWLVPTGHGPSFTGRDGDLRPSTAPYGDEPSRADGEALARRALRELMCGRR